MRRFANLKVFNDERASVEQLHARFQAPFPRTRCGKDDKVLDLVILEKRHVPAIEPRNPGRRGPRQSNIEKSAATRSEAALAPIAGFMPPTSFVPGVSRQGKQPPGWRHLGKI